tara:strand:+ start:3142 stop:3939 length:798 start_codon:yes stop_codon:yes gene_type:complete
MELVILCGGKGSRLAEETISKPKPLVEIGGKPILWHIMKLYSFYGVKRFILTLGYKGYMIKEYFFNYKMIGPDFELSFKEDTQINYLNSVEENDWEIVFVDTGEDTLKGGRIKKIEDYVRNDTFYLTYGDGIADLNVGALTKFHRSHNSLGTVTAVRPPSRFGELNIDDDDNVITLEEKPQMGKGLINGGFFVFHKKLFSYLEDDISCDFEFGPLQKISKAGELKAFKHSGFWQCMDNVRERDYLNELENNNKAPWMVWDNEKDI